MTLQYRLEPLPVAWPGRATPHHARKRAPFKTIETKALTLLGREIRHLDGRNVRIAVDVEERHIRQDGMLYANARPRSSSVIVSFDTPDGRLQFPCDRFSFFWANIDAVARALEDLRRVDRYGVQQGKQYTGFKALPAGSSTTLTTEAAARIVAEHSGVHVSEVLCSSGNAREAIRTAAARTHPDRNGGATEAFQRVQVARATLTAHFGVAV